MRPLPSFCIIVGTCASFDAGDLDPVEFSL